MLCARVRCNKTYGFHSSLTVQWISVSARCRFSDAVLLCSRQLDGRHLCAAGGRGEAVWHRGEMHADSMIDMRRS